MNFAALINSKAILPSRVDWQAWNWLSLRFLLAISRSLNWMHFDTRSEAREKKSVKRITKSVRSASANGVQLINVARVDWKAKWKLFLQVFVFIGARCGASWIMDPWGNKTLYFRKSSHISSPVKKDEENLQKQQVGQPTMSNKQTLFLEFAIVARAG